jgi:hypothetical protein
MSRQLLAKIQDIEGMPGKHKRVLLAWASFANNDGSNIFAGKKRVADRAGICRTTVYRNTDDLIAAGVLQRANSHTCKTPQCNKGGTHWTKQHGEYTVVYRINLPLLQNATVLCQKLEAVTVAKRNSATVAKRLKGTVAKWDATQALKETPVDTGQTETLALVPSALKQRKEGREEDSASFASLTTPMSSPDIVTNYSEHPDLTRPPEQRSTETNPLAASMVDDPAKAVMLEAEETPVPDPPVPPPPRRSFRHATWVYDQDTTTAGPLSKRLGRRLDIGEWDIVADLYHDFLPVATELPDSELVALAEIAIDMQMVYRPALVREKGTSKACYVHDGTAPIRRLWKWNKTHRAGTKYEFLTMSQMNYAWFSAKQITKIKFEAHDADACTVCKKDSKLYSFMSLPLCPIWIDSEPMVYNPFSVARDEEGEAEAEEQQPYVPRYCSACGESDDLIEKNEPDGIVRLCRRCREVDDKLRGKSTCPLFTDDDELDS